VLRCIAEHANEASADTAWPGVELMMLETGCSESVIVRTTGLLAKSGWITKTRRFGTSNLYRLNMAKLRAHQITKPAPKAVHMSEHLPALLFQGENLTELVADVAAKGGRVCPPSWSLVPGRSNAAARAARLTAAAAPARPVVDVTKKPQVTSYVDSTYVPHPDPAPHPKTSDRRNRSRRIDVNQHVESTTEPVVKDQRTNRQRTWAPAEAPGAATTATVCLPDIPSNKNKTHSVASSARVTASAEPSTRGEKLLAGLASLPVQPSVIRECAPQVDLRLSAQGGWTEQALEAWIIDEFAAAVARAGGIAEVRKPTGLLVSVLRSIPTTAYPAAGAHAAPARAMARQPWCRECSADEHRFVEHVIDTPAERTAWGHCPRCHPASVRAQQLVDA
jgi:hypothetical protein